MWFEHCTKSCSNFGFDGFLNIENILECWSVHFDVDSPLCYLCCLLTKCENSFCFHLPLSLDLFWCWLTPVILTFKVIFQNTADGKSLHHVGCPKKVWYGDKKHFGILSGAWFFLSTVFPHPTIFWQTSGSWNTLTSPNFHGNFVENQSKSPRNFYLMRCDVIL